MTRLFGREGLRRLRQFAHSRVMMAFDYDGTLAPITAVPDRARMRRSTRALLARLAARHPSVVISGRSRSDLLARLKHLNVAVVIGNHGVESWQPPPPARRTIRRWRTLLEASLAPFAGVEIEDKVYSLAVHYRRARNPGEARAAIHLAVSRFRNARIVAGKRVVNLLPKGSPDKRAALETALAHLDRETAIYVGDDETDEDVFAIRDPDRVLTIRVGRKQGSHAAYFLRNEGEIDRLLRLLLRLTPRAKDAADSAVSSR